jgi:hypothetical protein
MPERRFGYFLRRSLRAKYTIPMPLASNARLEGSGMVTFVAPAKADVTPAQTARSETRDTGTKWRFISIPRG